MSLLTRAVLFAVVLAVPAVAQTPHPTVMPFPLEFKRKPSGFPLKDADELQKDFLRLIRKDEVLVPDSASYAAALKELKRQDCERDDECLQQLAIRAGTLYALYASVEYTLEGRVVATGRVVRDDGQKVGDIKVVSLVKGTDAFRDVARVAIAQLVGQLGLKELPPTREVAAPKVDTPRVEAPKVEPKIEDGKPTPPPLVVHEGPRPRAIAQVGLVIAGGGRVGDGGGVGGAGEWRSEQAGHRGPGDSAGPS